MTAREEFTEQLEQRIVGDCDGDIVLAGRIASRIAGMCWPAVHRGYEEVDVTTLGDAEARIRWSMTVTGSLTFTAASGEYRKPLAGGWTATP